jgi:hypothetical protein
MQKKTRYFILLLILFLVAANEAWVKFSSTNWENSLYVRVYAVNGDESANTEKYIDSLSSKNFLPIEKFVNVEAKRNGINIDAIDVEYNGRLASQPPQPPSGQSILQNIGWSLRFRAWAMMRSWSSRAGDGDVELFVSYYDTRTTHSLRHSVGLEGGMIGIINAFAERSYQGSNNVVITHELLHTLGASDKYDANNLPMYPSGYAEPYREPLYPQLKAEIMGGRIPITAQELKMPESLTRVVIGNYTAREINWLVD